MHQITIPTTEIMGYIQATLPTWEVASDLISSADKEELTDLITSAAGIYAKSKLLYLINNKRDTHPDDELVAALGFVDEYTPKDVVDEIVVHLDAHLLNIATFYDNQVAPIIPELRKHELHIEAKGDHICVIVPSTAARIIELQKEIDSLSPPPIPTTIDDLSAFDPVEEYLLKMSDSVFKCADTPDVREEIKRILRNILDTY